MPNIIIIALIRIIPQKLPINKNLIFIKFEARPILKICTFSPISEEIIILKNSRQFLILELEFFNLFSFISFFSLNY